MAAQTTPCVQRPPPSATAWYAAEFIPGLRQSQAAGWQTLKDCRRSRPLQWRRPGTAAHDGRYYRPVQLQLTRVFKRA